MIHKDETSSYGVTVPDLPGCFSGGESYEGGDRRRPTKLLLVILKACLWMASLSRNVSRLSLHQGNQDYENGSLGAD